MSTPTTISPRRWLARAACRDADPDLFADRDLEKWPRPATVETAHDYCATCPVRAACDAYAERAGLVGVWGGKWRHDLDGRDGWSSVEVTDLLAPELAARPGVPAGMSGRRRKVWEAIPDAGYVTPSRIASVIGVDPRDVSVDLRWMARRGLVCSPRRGVWRRDGDLTAVTPELAAPRPLIPAYREVLAAVGDEPAATGVVIEATGLDEAQVRRALRALAARGLVSSPRWGFWRLAEVEPTGVRDETLEEAS